MAGLADNPSGDDRYYNNLFVGRGDLSSYDTARLRVWMDGNVFVNASKPSKHEKQPFVEDRFDPGVKVSEKDGGFSLTLRFDNAWGGDRVHRRSRPNYSAKRSFQVCLMKDRTACQFASTLTISAMPGAERVRRLARSRSREAVG